MPLLVTLTFEANATCASSAPNLDIDASTPRIELMNFAISQLQKRCFKTNPGFFPVTQLSDRVAAATRSVFKIYATDTTIEKSYPQLESDIIRLESEGDLQDSALTNISTKELVQIWRPYLQHCKELELKTCKVPSVTYLAGGSAASIGSDGSELWTNIHIIGDALDKALVDFKFKNYQDLVRSKLSMDVLIFVFDQDKRMIAHPLRDGRPKLIAAGPNKSRQSSEDPRLDFAILSFGKVLGVPLEVAPSASISGNIFALGFPDCTGCLVESGKAPDYLITDVSGKKEPSLTMEMKNIFSRAPYPNADGQSERFSTGQFKFFTSGSIARLGLLAMDISAGMSGGVALNFEGQVVGLNVGRSAEEQMLDNAVNSILYIVRPVSWN